MGAFVSTADYLAIDLGASSGRAVVGSFDGQALTLSEVHRFPNSPIELGVGLHWDTPRLFQEIKVAIGLVHRSGASLAGIGVDTWGVDYGLLDSTGKLLGPPFHYRDPRTTDMPARAFARMPREKIYARTGIQFLAFNTLYQLLADQHAADGRLERADVMLFMPDLLHFWLTGIQRSEHTIASTSQMYDPAAGSWATDILDAMGLPRHILPAVAEAGTPIGPLSAGVADETGAGPVTVIAPASHDTASAVAAVPGVGGDWAYISSGTWSLVGRELTAPIRTPESLAENFTNERGVGGTIRFHKNITGLWLLQECQRHWAAHGRERTFEYLCEIALDSPPLAAFVDPDDPLFTGFGDMPARVRAFCNRTGQTPPSSDGGIVRCILESLALKCRVVIDSLEALTSPVSTIHIVGGGVQNSLLCQFTADAVARPVFAGPVEATAIGNILTQALAHQRIASLDDIRSIVRASYRPALFQPGRAAQWGEAYGCFRALLRSGTTGG